MIDEWGWLFYNKLIFMPKAKTQKGFTLIDARVQTVWGMNYRVGN